MNILSIVSLFAILLTLAVIPSASVALVVTRSAIHGIPNGAAASAGIVLGDIIFAILAILGMSFLAETLGGFFAVFKYLGGAYLIWLGIGLLRTKASIEIQKDTCKSSALATSFLAGFFLTLGDIKAILFYASLFPAFVDMSSLNPFGIAVILTITVITVGGVKLTYAFGARAIVQKLHGRVRSRWVSKTAGSLMVGSGAYIISKA